MTVGTLKWDIWDVSKNMILLLPMQRGCEHDIHWLHKLVQQMVPPYFLFSCKCSSSLKFRGKWAISQRIIHIYCIYMY